MRRRVYSWSIDDLVANVHRINFPEYQRESTVWSRSAKQRLIDSIFRSFDIAPIYLYETADDIFDCIDGRQRVGTIMSFLGREDDARDNGSRYSSPMRCLTTMRILFIRSQEEPG